ncbi:superoxide dismutase family protein [Algibacter sp. 2305UL17-15]|uniref:superoxide dismutase family protein n=1 Tax=Algibacter sp. 2305UL17-15 TaxID=3231268 RepID=UPI00345867EB
MKLKSLNIVIVAFVVVAFGHSCKKDVNRENKNDIQNEPEELSKNNKTSDNSVNVEMQSVGESEVFGSAIFKENEKEVTMIALVNNLKEGNYKMYIVNAENCSTLVDSESLHWNPTHQKHGSWGDKSGYHKGDIGALKTDDLLRNGTLSFSTSEWCIGCEDSMKNVLGKRLIIVKDNNDSNSDGKNTNILSCGLIE